MIQDIWDTFMNKRPLMHVGYFERYKDQFQSPIRQRPTMRLLSFSTY